MWSNRQQPWFVKGWDERNKCRACPSRSWRWMRNPDTIQHDALVGWTQNCLSCLISVYYCTWCSTAGAWPKPKWKLLFTNWWQSKTSLESHGFWSGRSYFGSIKDPALTLWHSRRFVKLPGQQDLTALQVFPFSSIGVGERFQIFRHFFLSWEVKNFFTEKKKNLSLGKFYSNKNELQSMEDSKCLFDHPF